MFKAIKKFEAKNPVLCSIIWLVFCGTILKLGLSHLDELRELLP